MSGRPNEYPFVALLPCDLIAEIWMDLLDGRVLVPSSPPPPGREFEVPGCRWASQAEVDGDFGWTAYTPLTDDERRARALGDTAPDPVGPSLPEPISVSFRRSDAGIEGVGGIRRGAAYTGTTPRYEIFCTDRLDAIGAVAVQPQNWPRTDVHLPDAQITVHGPDYDVTLEAATRLAEYVVAHDIHP